MTGQNRTLPTLEEIKRIARVLKKESGIPHSEALERAAVLNGFQNYRHAYNVSAIGPIAPPPKKVILPPRFRIRVTQYWSDGDLGLRGKETLEIPLAKPFTDITSTNKLKLIRGLASIRHVGDTEYEMEFVTRSQEDAQELLYAAARVLAFMEATGLQPSTGYRRAYPPGETKVPGQDHARFWFDPTTRRYLVCDEPYQREFNAALPKRRAWLERFGYVMETPNWLGMYNPYMDATNGSRLHLITHATKGIDLGPLIASLNRLPAPIGIEPWSGLSGPKFAVQRR